MPISYDDIELMPDKEIIYNELKKLDKSKNPKNLEEYWLGSIEITILKLVKNYNQKMWMVDDNRIFKSFDGPQKVIQLEKEEETHSITK